LNYLLGSAASQKKQYDKAVEQALSDSESPAEKLIRLKKQLLEKRAAFATQKKHV